MILAIDKYLANMVFLQIKYWGENPHACVLFLSRILPFFSPT